MSSPGPEVTTTAGVGDAPALATVLIVDDQEPFRGAARTVVAMLPGWRVLDEAPTGERAVESAAQQRPDVILMDINLPGISGIEATRRILAADPSITVLLVSTYAAADLPVDALDCGAVGYVRKEDLTPHVLRTALPR